MRCVFQYDNRSGQCFECIYQVITSKHSIECVCLTRLLFSFVVRIKTFAKYIYNVISKPYVDDIIWFAYETDLNRKAK